MNTTKHLQGKKRKKYKHLTQAQKYELYNKAMSDMYLVKELCVYFDISPSTYRKVLLEIDEQIHETLKTY